MAVTPPRRSGAIGPLAYGALFVAALPAGLIWWAMALDAQLHLPVVHQPIIGGLLVAAGSATWIAGVIEIIRRGDGLPMNAFPPARYVSSGIYAVVAHPIYAGWTMACAGVSVQTGSAAGLWIVTPAVAIGCAALVRGYERPDLRRRFGASAMVRPWLSLPAEQPVPPRRSERLAVWVLTVLPWFIVCQMLAGGPRWPDAASATLAVLLAPTRGTLRRFGVQGLTTTTAVLLAPALGAGPALHLLWAAFAAETIGARSRAWSAVAWLWLVLCAAYAGATVSGPIAGRELVVFLACGAILWRPMATVRLALDGAEWLANSWRAWRFGPVRVISHGVFAGLAAAVGVVIVAALAGASSLPGIVALALSTLIGAGLWAQFVEGSPRLLRPFGYYGGVIGGLLASGVMALMGQPIGVMLGAVAVAAPWVHSIGRVRCLVQGCCHGRVTDDPRSGIRVSNPHSRAVALAGLEGQPIHATPLYSIAGNLVIGVLLLRAWTSGAPVWFIVGLYLIGAGLARFIEEGYRGEPQTIAWFGLPVYQYLAVASVLTGVVFTTWGGPPPPHGSWPDAGILAVAFGMGAVYWFAMGVDFPESSRRFARLSG